MNVGSDFQLGEPVLHVIFLDVDFVKELRKKTVNSSPRAPKTYRQSFSHFIPTSLILRTI